MPVIRTAAVAVLALLLAVPAAAYTIYLKDGSKLVSQERYTVEDGTAYIVLLNGTTTFIDASEIDVPRTEEANERQLGSALVLEGGQVREMTDEDARPIERQRTLADLISARGDEPADERERSRRPAPEEEEEEDGDTAIRTAGGYRDLGAVPPRPLNDLDLAAEIHQMFVGQGLELVEVHQGTASRRPLVRVTAGSEALVFRTVAVTCAALTRLRESQPDQVEALELVIRTPEQERAGQFVVTPEAAAQLMAKEVDIATFFLAHVQF